MYGIFFYLRQGVFLLVLFVCSVCWHTVKKKTSYMVLGTSGNFSPNRVQLRSNFSKPENNTFSDVEIFVKLSGSLYVIQTLQIYFFETTSKITFNLTVFTDKCHIYFNSLCSLDKSNQNSKIKIGFVVYNNDLLFQSKTFKPSLEGNRKVISGSLGPAAPEHVDLKFTPMVLACFQQHSFFLYGHPIALFL